MLSFLVVDDSSFLHSILKVSLRRYCDCQITYANNGAEALEALREREPDLILLDVNMPVMSGLEFLSHVGESALERVPVIIVSTEGEEEDVVRGLEAGATAYLRKPFKEAELHDLLDRVVGQAAT